MKFNHKTHTAKNVLFVLCLLTAFLVSIFYHNRFWWGPDDGYFGYIAEKILDGKVIHRDINVLHSGLIYFINSVFYKLADGDLVGLRYPLIAMTIIQTAIAFKLAEHRGILVSIAAANVATGFSFIHFINPSPNWYALFLAFVLIYVLSKCDVRRMKIVILIGILVGVAFHIRQLSGAILAVGVSTVILLKNADGDDDKSYAGGRIILLLLALVTSLYVLNASKFSAWLIVGVYPPAVLVISALKSNVSWSRCLQIIGLLILGAIISAIPLAIYYAAHGAFLDWLHGTFISPFTLGEMSFLKAQNYLAVLVVALLDLGFGNYAALDGLFYWIVFLTAPTVLGVHVINRLVKGKDDIPVEGILACIFSLVAIHYESYLYLYFCIGVIFLGTLLTIQNRKDLAWYSFVVILAAILAIFFQAGESLTRDYRATASLTKANSEKALVPNHSIIFEKKSRLEYLKIMEIVNKCSLKNDTMYTFPMNPELYLMVDREPAFKFVKSYIGLATKSDLKQSAAILNGPDAPSLIIYTENNKYITPMALELFEQAKHNYTKLGKIGRWTVYQHLDRVNPESCPDLPAVSDP